MYFSSRHDSLFLPYQPVSYFLFFFNDPATTEIYTLSLPDALPILFARNPWNAEFGSRVAFADLAGRQTQWTADRREFLGRPNRKSTRLNSRHGHISESGLRFEKKK